MGDQLHVEPDTLRRGGQGILSAAQQVAEEWQRFSAKVQGMGDIFGDDAVGGLIGASYQAAHQIADKCFASVAKGFGGFGTGLGGWPTRTRRPSRTMSTTSTGLAGRGSGWACNSPVNWPTYSTSWDTSGRNPMSRS
jgi:hypothetical protein